MNLHGVRFGYVPYTRDLSNPGDRRRFVWWARERGVRWEQVRPGAAYDVVLLAGTADLVRWRERRRDRPKVVFELIDSYLELPAGGVKSRLRGAAKFLSGELSRPVLSHRRLLEDMCQAADAVVCSTPEQSSGLRRLNANVHAILDAHFDLATVVKDDYALSSPARLVWEGLPYTLDDLAVIAPALDAVGRRRPIDLHLLTDLGFRRYARRFVSVRTADIVARTVPEAHLHRWDADTLARFVTGCDLAMIPLDLGDPMARAKPENKLLLLWRLGLPAIVSATPAYERVMAAAGINGMTCRTPSDWETALERILDDHGARRIAALAGRRYVEHHHGRDAMLARWDALFRSVLA